MVTLAEGSVSEPGYRRRFHQVWGRGQGIQKLFQKFSGELIFFPLNAPYCALWGFFFLERKCDVVEKAGDFSIRPTVFYSLLSVWPLGVLLP